jgi:hypothetical protein
VVSNVFSRPNDDAFQNTAGKTGLPYEVAKVFTGLSFYPQNGKLNVQMSWGTSMSTGRYVEGASDLAITQTKSNIDGASLGKENRFSLSYAPGANSKSQPKEKVGSLIHQKLDLGNIDLKKDGVYQGKILITKRHEDLPSEKALEIAEKDAIQFIPWRIEMKNGKVIAADIYAERSKPPHLKLIASNQKIFDPKEPLFNPYVPVPPVSELLPEIVGDKQKLTEDQKLTVVVGQFIKSSGCLKCHGSDNPNQHLFHDKNGVPINPGEFAKSMEALLDNPHQLKDSDKYPPQMAKAIALIPENAQYDVLLRRWIELVKKFEANFIQPANATKPISKH